MDRECPTGGIKTQPSATGSKSPTGTTSAQISTAIEPYKRIRTTETYRSVVKRHFKPALGLIPLQKLRPGDIEAYYVSKRRELAVSTLEQHSAILFAALKSAELKKLISRNPAELVENKPNSSHRQANQTEDLEEYETQEDAIENCWEVEEAVQFLSVCKTPQQAAFYGMFLELGLRKGEGCGLRWKESKLDRGIVTISRQLLKVGTRREQRAPLFGLPKNGMIRKLDISPELVALLVAHRKHQSEVKMRNRTTYRDHGLVFAKEGGNVGDPLQANNIGQREFAKLVEEAGVRPIKFHGLRHTSATLALQNNVRITVVQARLGHKRIETTMDIYAHALPSDQKNAAQTMGSLLHK